MTFDEIMAPLGAEPFLAEYLGRQPLHLQGPPAKFQAVMNWDVLNRLLGASTIWSAQSMVLVLDKEQVPAGRLLRAGARPRRAHRAAARPGAGQGPPRPRRHAGLERHRPAHARALGLRARAGGAPRRQGAGEPLSVEQAQAGLSRAFRLPRRVRRPRHGREDLDGVRGPAPTTRSSTPCSTAGRRSGTRRRRASCGARCA